MEKYYQSNFTKRGDEDKETGYDDYVKNPPEDRKHIAHAFLQFFVCRSFGIELKAVLLQCCFVLFCFVCLCVCVCDNTKSKQTKLALPK